MSISKLMTALPLMFLFSCSPADKSGLEGWEQENGRKLVELVRSEGSSSETYTPDNKPYAVFDFDCTSIKNDVEVSLMAYQLTNLRFRLHPGDIYSAITGCLTDVNMSNASGVTAAMLARDITADYKLLYDSYISIFPDPYRSEAVEALSAVSKSDEFKDFRAKMFALYDMVDENCDYGVSLLWILKLLNGFTNEEVTALTKEACRHFMSMGEVREVIWESPDMGECGRVASSHNEGIVVTAAMTNLYNLLRSSGFDIYICSASLEIVVEAMACDPEYGFNMDADHVFGLRLRDNGTGVIDAEYDTGYIQTYKEGKTKAIRKYIAPAHNDEDPDLVAGDSNGDVNMLTDFQDMKYGIIVDVGRTGEIAELIRSGNTKYLIHRDF